MGEQLADRRTVVYVIAGASRAGKGLTAKQVEDF